MVRTGPFMLGPSCRLGMCLHGEILKLALEVLEHSPLGLAGPSVLTSCLCCARFTP